VLADNFRGVISLNSLGPGIPRDHSALRVQHKNRIILDTFYEQPEWFLSLVPFNVGQYEILSLHAGNYALPSNALSLKSVSNVLRKSSKGLRVLVKQNS
jgi:hypothetical protein